MMKINSKRVTIGLRRHLGARIVGSRQRKGWSQEMLAARLDVPRERLAKWESGVHAPPPEVMVVLSEVLEISLDELFTGKRHPLADLWDSFANHVDALNELLKRKTQLTDHT